MTIQALETMTRELKEKQCILTVQAVFDHSNSLGMAITAIAGAIIWMEKIHTIWVSESAPSIEVGAIGDTPLMNESVALRHAEDLREIARIWQAYYLDFYLKGSLESDSAEAGLIEGLCVESIFAKITEAGAFMEQYALIIRRKEEFIQSSPEIARSGI